MSEHAVLSCAGGQLTALQYAEEAYRALADQRMREGLGEGRGKTG